MAQPSPTITVIGAGLAGCELSFQLAEAGFVVRLVEMKPHRHTPAQQSDGFAELVCSNSLRSSNPHNAVGLLKEEMSRLGSLVMSEAHRARVPAGDALAVDRVEFSRSIESRLRAHPRICVEQRVVRALPPREDGPCIIATGPLTDTSLAESIQQASGTSHLAFYDAIAPIVSADSLNHDEMFAASRWDKGPPQDYLNCPLDQPAYLAVIDFLRHAACYPTHDFEEPKFFHGCMPIEAMAAQGEQTLRFGPLKPVGLTHPATGRWPYAVVQLRAEDRQRQAYNLVGMQTKLKQGEQKKLLGMIPGLRNAQILRFGAMHRNTFIDSPALLNEQLQLISRPHIRFAGQITGVEGYIESAACGLICAFALRHAEAGRSFDTFLPEDTALGALWRHILGVRRLPGRPHEPQNINWGMWPALPQGPKIPRRQRPDPKAERVAAARSSLTQWASAVGYSIAPAPMPPPESPQPSEKRTHHPKSLATEQEVSPRA